MGKRLYRVTFTYEVSLMTFDTEVTVECGGEWRFTAKTPDDTNAVRSKLITHGLQLKDAKRVRFSEVEVVDGDRF